MAREYYRFFNSSTDDERSYDADDMASAFRALAQSGVAALDGANLKVNAEGSTMRTLVGYGSAVVKGYHYELRDDGGVQTAFTHSASAANDRIDRIVLRLDLTARTIGLLKREGTAAASPVPPELVRTGTVYEISLARVRVRDGATAIEPTDVTDERADESVCGAALPEGAKLSLLWDRMAKVSASQSVAGLMSAADKQKLDGLTGEMVVMGGTDARTLKAAITGAQGAADTAQETAEAAQTAADEAQASADAAQSSANTAQAAHNVLVGAISTGAYLQLQTGVCTFRDALPNNALNRINVTFPVPYTSSPRVMLTLNCTSCHMFTVSASAITPTGFSVILRNALTRTATPKVFWTAIGKLNTEITINDALIENTVIGEATGGDEE